MIDPTESPQGLDGIRDQRLAVAEKPGCELPHAEEEVEHETDRTRPHAAVVLLRMDPVALADGHQGRVDAWGSGSAG
jgi:hypothetical protein